MVFPDFSGQAMRCAELDEVSSLCSVGIELCSYSNLFQEVRNAKAV